MTRAEREQEEPGALTVERGDVDEGGGECDEMLRFTRPRPRACLNMNTIDVATRHE